MRVIGTAGHVDHGKSTLIEALTGTHPDRLKEEREREMTIDLGFAWLTLPDGEEVGIIDVPGHRDFIENMLSGVGGIDAALFVIAADEGVMPQTREHLAILNLLQVQGGVVALNKIDMVDDPEWLDLVEEEVRQVLVGSVLEDAPIIRVSGRKKIGMQELKEALRFSLADRPSRLDFGRPRLPIDRVFSIAGFGTVVTGTLGDGYLRVGDDVEILPEHIRGRVRGLQTHKRKEDAAVPGSRTAVNISGVNVEDINRGDVVVHPKDYRPTGRFDAKLNLLPEASSALKHNTEVKLFIGAAEVLARLRVLGQEEINPGEEGWVQLEVKQPVVAVRGDRYIIRRPSPGETLGGGVILDPHPKGRYKRFAGSTLERLKALERGSPEDVLVQTITGIGIVPLKDIAARSSLNLEALQQALEALTDDGRLVFLEAIDPQSITPNADILVTTRTTWDQVANRTIQMISEYHKTYPLRRGIPREELKSRLKLSPRVFNAVLRNLASPEVVLENGPLVRIPEHEIRFNPEQKRAVEALLARFKENPFAPPTVKESQAALGEDVYQALLESGELVQVSGEVVFRKEDYERMLSEVEALLNSQGTLSAAQFRDHFNTSRRYALAFLEHLDGRGVTVREGDVRRLKQ
ncbi:MAG: selenocysteine-specific translation elongation factor [Anaerolineales bacterium]